jgi:hypothetical protein
MARRDDGLVEKLTDFRSAPELVTESGVGRHPRTDGTPL